MFNVLCKVFNYTFFPDFIYILTSKGRFVCPAIYAMV